MTQSIRLSTCLRPLALFVAVAACVTGPAHADIQLRVESRPNTEAIEAFVRVTDGGGQVTALTPADFAVTLDGAALDTFTLSLPPDQDPAQKVSVVVLVAERLFPGSSILEAATDFINQMGDGDYASVVRFQASFSDLVTRGYYLGRPVAQTFTQIDGGAGTASLIDFLSVPVFGRSIGLRSGVTLFDAISLAVGEFVAPPVALPNGPKAIILIGYDRDRYSSSTQSDVVAYANENGIPVFTVGVGDIVHNAEVNALMASLAADTGGTYLIAPDNAQIAETFEIVAGLLKNAYRLTIPQSAVTDCYPHVLAVTSQGQSDSFAFTRCDSTPDELQFASREGVAPGTLVVSDAVTITSIESPIAIGVSDGGEYSVGCSGTFTATSGYILPGSQVCVRHWASVASGDSTSILLITGGVSSSFWSSTSAAPPPQPLMRAPAGGGATGVIELLLVLGTLLLRRGKGKRCQVHFSQENKPDTFS